MSEDGHAVLGGVWRVAAAKDEETDRPRVVLDTRDLQGTAVTLVLLPGDARLLAAQLGHEADVAEAEW